MEILKNVQYNLMLMLRMSGVIPVPPSYDVDRDSFTFNVCDFNNTLLSQT